MRVDQFRSLEQNWNVVPRPVLMPRHSAKHSCLPKRAQDELLAALARTRHALVAAQRQLRRGAPLSRALDPLFIDIDDMAFLVTHDRNYFLHPGSAPAQGPDPAYRHGRHEQSHLEGYSGLDKQTRPEPETGE